MPGEFEKPSSMFSLYTVTQDEKECHPRLVSNPFFAKIYMKFFFSLMLYRHCPPTPSAYAFSPNAESKITAAKIRTAPIAAGRVIPSLRIKTPTNRLVIGSNVLAIDDT